MEKYNADSDSSTSTLSNEDIVQILNTVSYNDIEQFNNDGDAMYPVITDSAFLALPIPVNFWSSLIGNIIVVELSEEDIYVGRLVGINNCEVSIKPENPKYNGINFARTDIEKIYVVQTRHPQRHDPADLIFIWGRNPSLPTKRYLFEYLEWNLGLKQDRLERPEIHARAIYELSAKIPGMIHQAKGYIGSSKQLIALQDIYDLITKALNFTDPVELMQMALESERPALLDCLAEVKEQINKIEGTNDSDTYPVKLSHAQIAILHYINQWPLNENNANDIAKKYGQTSGQKLYQTYKDLTSELTRTGKGKNRVKDYLAIESLVLTRCKVQYNKELNDAKGNNKK